MIVKASCPKIVKASCRRSSRPRAEIVSKASGRRSNGKDGPFCSAHTWVAMGRLDGPALPCARRTRPKGLMPMKNPVCVMRRGKTGKACQVPGDSVSPTTGRTTLETLEPRLAQTVKAVKSVLIRCKSRSDSVLTYKLTPHAAFAVGRMTRLGHRRRRHGAVKMRLENS